MIKNLNHMNQKNLFPFSVNVTQYRFIFKSWSVKICAELASSRAREALNEAASRGGGRGWAV